MRVIGITGGIGSGKTTVAALYRSQGVPTIDADGISRALTAPGGEALPAIREAFGDDVFNLDGTLHRAALAKKVFTDNPVPRAKLNGILHPMITRRLLDELNRLQAAGEPIALMDVPLLFEAGIDKLCDAVICITAPEAAQVKRIRDRDHISREEALHRIRSQNTAERTKSLSDYVLDTDAPMEKTRERALALWRQVLTEGPKRTPCWLETMPENAAESQAER